MKLKEALSVLSKASPLAVTTSGVIENPEFRRLKEYLYVPTDIERDFKELLTTLSSGQIIFLCGSSGDGKSEILTRYEKEFSYRVDFHLDATHSFEPNQTAIEALNELFRDRARTRRPLVIGINIGMMANFEREGSEEFHEIKAAIRKFLDNPNKKHPPLGNDEYYFLNFEAYPKFEFTENRISAAHMQALIHRVVQDDQGNIFRDYFNRALGEVENKNADATTKKLVSNYLILRDKGVQKTIVELLLNARVREDQFITNRMLLDFVHYLIAGDDHIWNNLFAESENELTSAISNFDPSVKRTEVVDKLILNLALDLENTQFELFKSEVKEKFKVTIRKNTKPSSTIRLIFILKNSSLESGFSKELALEFEDPADAMYRSIWKLHNEYSGSTVDKKSLKYFYENIVFHSIGLYANRNAPNLPSGDIFLTKNSIYKIATEAKFRPDFVSIEDYKSLDIHAFDLQFTVNKFPVKPIPLSVNLLSTMLQINNGLKPNKFDKNSVVIIDELVSKILARLSGTDELNIYGDENRRIKVSYSEEDREIEVSGL